VIRGQKCPSHTVRERDAEAVSQRNATASLQLADVLPEGLVEVIPFDNTNGNQISYDGLGVRLASVAVRIIIDFAKIDCMGEALRVEVCYCILDYVGSSLVTQLGDDR